jgi:hypothetical protein
MLGKGRPDNIRESLIWWYKNHNPYWIDTDYIHRNLSNFCSIYQEIANIIVLDGNLFIDSFRIPHRFKVHPSHYKLIRIQK